MTSLDPLSSVVSALKREQLIPDVVPETFTPTVLFSIIWPNGTQVVLSSEIAVEKTQEEPDISITPMGVPEGTVGGKEPSYTLVMTDPDAPSRADPKFGQFRHWVITGIKSGSGALTAFKTKPSTTPYRGPGPRPDSGIHRYTFLLYEEPNLEPLSIPARAPEYGTALEERRSWNAVKFGETYNLKLVGANFFLVQSST